MKRFLPLLLVACTSQLRQTPAKPDIKEEPGLWRICYDADGEVLDYEGECARPREVTWSLPIMVYVPPELPGHKEVMRALGVWNDWLGTDVLIATENNVDPDVEVKVMGPASEGPGLAGMAPHVMRMTGEKRGRPQFQVLLWTPYNTDVAVVTHEFGHVLGLFHDTGYPMSVMYPGMGWYLPTLTKHDCRLLTAKYKLPNVC